ncbi:MAG TPA: hypothetical protein VIH59_31705 [Candidatus Tectomicrobia bacterium]
MRQNSKIGLQKINDVRNATFLCPVMCDSADLACVSPRPPNICQHDVRRQRLQVDAEAIASVGRKQAHQQWLWRAMETTSRQAIAVHVGGQP